MGNNKIKPGLWALLLLFIALHTPASGQRTVAESEYMRFRAQISRDTALLSGLVANDLMYIHSNALVETKAGFLHTVGGGAIQYLSMEKTESDAIRAWGKTGLSRGVVKVSGIFQGAAFDMTLRFTSVYRKEKGTWKLFSWQSTRVL